MNERRDPREEAEQPKGGQASGWGRAVGISLMVAAVLVWLLAVVVFFLPLTGAQKVAMTSALLVGGEIFFWASAAFLGRELFRRYRSRLDPRRLFRKKDR